ncbi:MAG: amidohydrolase family protein, partial [Candidatus Mariimomonas ferrooxydans]
AVEVAERHDIPMHTHLSETKWELSEIKKRYGKTPVEYLDSTGFLNERLNAAHCVWLTDGDIEILAERKVGVSHCIESNLKLASGIAPVTKMLRAGVKLSLGTDGAASNNDLNILSELSTAAKIHKAVSGDPTAVDSKTALLMATRWGAEVLGMGDKIGSIRPGKRADLVIANLERPHLTPIYDIYSAITYSMRPSDVQTVMVNGKIVVENSELVTMDESEIITKSRKWQEKIRGQ